MGLSGWWYWLGEKKTKLEELKAITKDKEQLAIIDELIADCDSKLEEK
jgi:hypothetical protein